MSFFSKKEPKIKKLSIVCFSGEYDRALVAFNLATSAATIGYEVHMFFTFWGLNIIKKEKGRRMIGSSPVQKITHFFMGGSKNLREDVQKLYLTVLAIKLKIVFQ